MHIHILGICGAFMGGIALLARALGHRVTGSDTNVYPPMSTQLAAAGIGIHEGYDAAQLEPPPDLVVVANAMKRGLPVIEALLDRGLAYCSGPAWLRAEVLQGRWGLAVSGTHGKTTTASMLAWVLDQAGLNPGLLIGGVPCDFGVSARLGEGPFFVVEADEYDTAFFDKRSKFVHYGPKTLIINNLEFDHADIFEDLQQIQRQFHHLIRTVPGSGLIVSPAQDQAIETVLAQGCWTPRTTFGPGGDWQAEPLTDDGARFQVLYQGREVGRVEWGLIGAHNIHNALAALAAAFHVGIEPEVGCQALSRFQGVKRRLELRGEVAGIRVLDDFAHHPTAISATIAALRHQVGGQRILAVLEPRSNSMRLGAHNATLADSLSAADRIYLYAPPELSWDPAQALAGLGDRLQVYADIAPLVEHLAADSQSGDQILIMSNGGFAGIHQRLLETLRARYAG